MNLCCSTGNKNVIEGHAYPKHYNPAIWDYRVNSGLPKYLSRIMPGSGKYFILDTDYDNYAIMYSCSNLGLFHSGKILQGKFEKTMNDLYQIIYVFQI